MAAVENARGGYIYLPAGFPFSSGAAAMPGYEVVQAVSGARSLGVMASIRWRSYLMRKDDRNRRSAALNCDAPRR